MAQVDAEVTLEMEWLTIWDVGKSWTGNVCGLK
jgi:hypothetical protein